MKKSLVALAVLAATGAYAQSSVTLYGIVEATTDIGYNRKVESATTSTNNNAFGTTTSQNTTTVSNQQKNGFRVQDGNDQGTGTSRVGFRGAEDLGGGLKANFVLEMGLRIDDGCTTLTANGGCNNGGGSGNSGGSTFGRNAWGGISGGFGEVRLGRQVLGSYGVQANSDSSGASNGLYNASAAFYVPIGGVRFSNAIRYISPNMGGFTGSLMLSAPETNADTSTNTTTTNNLTGTSTVASGNVSRRTGVDLALEYANGPAYVGFGYNVRDSANSVSGSLTNIAGNLSSSALPGKITGYTLGGSYDFGVVKPFVNYTRETVRGNGAVTLAPSAAALPLLQASAFSFNNDSTSRAFSVGLRAPVGAFTMIAAIGTVRTSSLTSDVTTTNNAVGGPTVLGNNGNNAFRRNSYQLGTQYALSKRTLIEANYGQTRLTGNTVATGTNNTVGALNAVSESRGSSADRTSAFNVGLKHSF